MAWITVRPKAQGPRPKAEGQRPKAKEILNSRWIELDDAERGALGISEVRGGKLEMDNTHMAVLLGDLLRSRQRFLFSDTPLCRVSSSKFDVPSLKFRPRFAAC
jgi:hypothetical protein